VARAKGLATRLLTREAIDALAEADDLAAFAHGLSGLGTAIVPIGEPVNVFAIERAVGRTAHQYLRTLHRWQERMPGVLDVFAAHQDRRSLRALLRGAAQGAPAEARLDGLLPTPSLPQLALTGLAHQASAADVVRQLLLLAHPDAGRLLPSVQKTQVDLLAVDATLLVGFAERATRAADGDDTLREFVRSLIDTGNAQNALLLAREPREIDLPDLFVPGGQWLSAKAFISAAGADSTQRALKLLATALAPSPLASSLPVVAGDVAQMDRAFLAAALERLERAGRLDPLSTAPALRVLLLIEAQSHDLRTLAWGAAFGTPPSLRKEQLVTPP
jgi:vacuolar-type H+-ATPase subunit C/Vma6